MTGISLALDEVVDDSLPLSLLLRLSVVRSRTYQKIRELLTQHNRDAASRSQATKKSYSTKTVFRLNFTAYSSGAGCTEGLEGSGALITE
jgi:hypothetical protein